MKDHAGVAITRRGDGMNRARGVRWIAAGWMLAVLAACGGGQDAQQTPSSAQTPLAADAFTVLAGSELRDIEPQLRDAARKAGVEVAFSYAGTLDIVDRINAGEHFDAILPPNGAYPALALRTKPLAREKLFYSRVALGVKTAKAQALGWDAKTPSWRDIAQAAKAGQLRYAMTNPTSSNTGMSALFAVAAAAAHKTEDLAVADVDADVLRDFLSGQALTAGSSGWLADAFAKDAAALDGIVNYEAVLLRLNDKLAAGDRLSLIYPTDGVISADYPLMLLDAAKRETWQKLVDAIKGVAFQHDVLQAAYLRPANPDAAPAAALPSAAVAELTFPNQLDVIDAVLQAYQSEWRRPSTSIFVLDTSGSMQGERLRAMRDALKILSGADTATLGARLARFQNRERVVLIAFSSRVAPPRTMVFDKASLAQAQEEVRSFADKLTADGGTAIYSALAEAQQAALKERQADAGRLVSIVLLTDGENNEGLSPAAFRRRYGDAQVRIFPILFGEADTAELRALAELTGGRTFDARDASLAAVFKEIRGYQ
jgi:Ca-activated chloride channel homolog